MKYDIIIIGGGPGGMMSGIKAKQSDEKILIVEKNNRLGKKLSITGHGRCNITNYKPVNEILKKYDDKERKFIKHSLYSLRNDELLDLFKNKGLDFKVEDNNRVFPATDNAESVVNILVRYINDLNIHVKLNSEVTDVSVDEDGFNVKTSDDLLKSDRLIVATGGYTYQNTGSTGFGYEIAKKLGHHISEIKPGHFPFIINDSDLRKLKGLSFDNVKVSFKNNENKKIIEEGSLLITHNGITGPVIINLSKEFIRNQDYNLLKNQNTFKKEKISIDFIPSMNREKLKDDMIDNSNTNQEIHNYLRRYLPNRFIKYFLNKISIDSSIRMNSLNRKDRNRIINSLKDFELTVDNIIEKASFITVGGVKLNEINSKTMESKIVPGLYFAGELLDITGPTGGYNLQIAFTTGNLAGISASESLNSK